MREHPAAVLREQAEQAILDRGQVDLMLSDQQVLGDTQALCHLANRAVTASIE